MMSMRSITTWSFKPCEPFEWAARYASLEGTLFLYSGKSASCSYLCLFPEGKISLDAKEGGWESLQNQLGLFDCEGTSLPKWIGCISYEMGGFVDPQKTNTYYSSAFPGALFYLPRVIIVFNHQNQKATLYGDQHLPAAASIRNTAHQLTLKHRSDDVTSYLDKIALAKEWILDGEIYQVNLSQTFTFEGHFSSFSLFEQLASLNPAPFSAYFNCGAFTIISSSPERLVKKTGTLLETRPIKGTAPRGNNKKLDEENREKLLNSPKERAELLMITDLMRNDLAKVSKPRTVQVKKLYHCEEYSNVFHLLSMIEGRCFENDHPVKMLRALFPGGSVTGCPKLRAMEAISALEKRARGIYTGSIGYFAENGDFDFNIAIRTLIASGDSLEVQLGGGIVADSDPISEYEETLHKGSSLFKVLGYEHCLF